MIDVKYNLKNNNIINFSIKGHAESTFPGENDLVCAGTSAIVFGILNSLNHEFTKIIVKDNLITIKVLKEDAETQIILKILITSLKTVENQYHQYIKIIKE